MGGQYQHLSNLDVFRRIGGKDSHVGNIITCQRLNTFIDIGGTIIVAMETDIAEVCLYKSRLQVRHADGGIGDVDT